MPRSKAKEVLARIRREQKDDITAPESLTQELRRQDRIQRRAEEARRALAALGASSRNGNGDRPWGEAPW